MRPYSEGPFSRLGGPRTLTTMAGLVVLIALGDWGYRRVVSRWFSPTRGAAWIWAELGEGKPDAHTCFAVRDFDLETVPASALLKALADEELLLLLNGTPVGSRRYEEGLPLAVWEVSGLLRRGRNRLTAELRSGRGLGGFLLTLETAEGVLLATGPEWRIVRRYDPVLLNPELPLAESEPPRVWAFGATGRWGAPEEGAVGPLYGALVEDPAGRFAVRARALESSQWHPMGAVDGRSPPISERVIFDWGREVFGYPSLIFGGTEGAMALIWAGLRPPGATGPVASYAVNVAGRPSWTDSEPLRFRYLIVHSTRPVVGARVFVIVPDQEERFKSRAARTGVFGLEPARSIPAVEDEIRRQLESVPSGAGG